MKTNTALLVLILSLFLYSCEKEEEVLIEKQQVLPPAVDWISKLKISSSEVSMVWYRSDTVATAFEVEKKVGNSAYQVVSRLDGAAVSNDIYSYSFTDYNPEKYEVTHYRIRSFSPDDTSEYINIPPLVVGEIFKTGEFSNARYKSELIRTEDGNVVMIGGYKYLTTAFTQIFTPSTGKWQSGPAMTQERSGHKAILLKDGKIIATGGTNSDKHFTSTELYNPATNTFSSGADMNYPHTSHTITTLQNGNVLVVAGYKSNSVFSDKCEIYYPDKNEWKEIASLNVARAGHQTFQLKNGDILVIGGVTKDTEGFPTTSCELYSFSTNTWKEVGQLLSLRKDFTAFEVDDSNILVAAGENWETDTQVEVYNTSTFSSSRQPNSLFNYHSTEATDLANGLVLLYGQVYFGLAQDLPFNLQVYDKNTKQWLLTNFLSGDKGILLEPNKTLFTNMGNESLVFQLRLER